MSDISREERFLIRKNGYWYGPDSRGYTTSAIQAGRYTMDQAYEITHPNGPDGPRDGMSYIAEHLVDDGDLKAYRALLARVDEQRGYQQGLDAAIAAGQEVYDKLCAKTEKVGPERVRALDVARGGRTVLLSIQALKTEGDSDTLESAKASAEQEDKA